MEAEIGPGIGPGGHILILPRGKRTRPLQTYRSALVASSALVLALAVVAFVPRSLYSGPGEIEAPVKSVAGVGAGARFTASRLAAGIPVCPAPPRSCSAAALHGEALHQTLTRGPLPLLRVQDCTAKSAGWPSGGAEIGAWGK
jgi:hypothetical protein